MGTCTGQRRAQRRACACSPVHRSATLACSAGSFLTLRAFTPLREDFRPSLSSSVSLSSSASSSLRPPPFPPRHHGDRRDVRAGPPIVANVVTPGATSDPFQSRVEPDLPTFRRGRYLATRRVRTRTWVSTITFDCWEQMAEKRQVPGWMAFRVLLRREGSRRDQNWLTCLG